MFVATFNYHLFQRAAVLCAAESSNALRPVLKDRRAGGGEATCIFFAPFFNTPLAYLVLFFVPFFEHRKAVVCGGMEKQKPLNEWLYCFYIYGKKKVLKI